MKTEAKNLKIDLKKTEEWPCVPKLKKKQEVLKQEKLEKQEQYAKDIFFSWTLAIWSRNWQHSVSYERDSDKIAALKAQLKFRKEVLHQKPEERSTFNFTRAEEGKKSRESLSLEELVSNLKILVRQAIV